MRSRRASRDLFRVTWVVGIPQSGKTTLAVSRAIERARARRCPLLAIDPTRVAQLRGIPHASSPEEAIEALYAAPQARVAFSSSDIETVDALLRCCRAGKGLVVFVDEAHHFLSAQSGSSAELVSFMRETQHARCDLFLTTQHLSGDIPQSALSCTSDLHVFRCTAPRVLRLLETEFGIPRARVGSLPQFHFLTVRIGF